MTCGGGEGDDNTKEGLLGDVSVWRWQWFSATTTAALYAAWLG
jgi:hypothetical protein